MRIGPEALHPGVARTRRGLRRHLLARTSGAHLGVETNRFYAALGVCGAETPRFVIATLARKRIEVARPLGDEYQ